MLIIRYSCNLPTRCENPKKYQTDNFKRPYDPSVKAHIKGLVSLCGYYIEPHSTDFGRRFVLHRLNTNFFFLFAVAYNVTSLNCNHNRSNGRLPNQPEYILNYSIAFYAELNVLLFVLWCVVFLQSITDHLAIAI